ncbi:MAG: DUF433 domain-containing protein [Deltaproteobacteria bacterium]|nr:DUF433 domain-containing protein [Deltaproteobacteria bacterium]
MKNEKLLKRIILDPKVMAGKPVIRGTRLTVDFIPNLFAHGATENEILDEYKGLTVEDIQACFLFATKFLESTDFMPLMESSA